jgi:excisionase family DNA binding protein
METPWMTIDEVCEYTKYGKNKILGLIRNERLAVGGTGNGRRVDRGHLDRQMRLGFPKLNEAPIFSKRRRGGHVTRLV